MSVHPPSPARPSQSDLAALLSNARRAASAWGNETIAKRLAHLSRWREALVAGADQIATDSGRVTVEVISSEIIPLADACRFLERRAAKILRVRKLGRRDRAGWLRGVSTTIHREALGAVLIIAPSNYPLFLPGVGMLQALAAGNAVVIKPGEGGIHAARTLAKLATDAGFPSDLVQVLDDSAETGRAALECGFDKILFTGSAATGRKVLSASAATLTPATVELSGCDACIVLSESDIERAVAAIAFGLVLNGGCTCIAPRRIFVHESRADDLIRALKTKLANQSSILLAEATAAKISTLAGGAEPAVGGFDKDGHFAPAIYTGLPPDHALASADIFAPLAVVLPFSNVATAVEQANQCPYALGASVFGPATKASEVADQLRVGVVTVNDLIVPTADARVPFGGRGESGFGTTRGSEGLLALTRPKVVAVRKGNWLPHTDPPQTGDADLLSGFLALAHGRKMAVRFAGLRRIVRAIRSRKTKNINNLET